MSRACGLQTGIPSRARGPDQADAEKFRIAELGGIGGQHIARCELHHLPDRAVGELGGRTMRSLGRESAAVMASSFSGGNGATVVFGAAKRRDRAAHIDIDDADAAFLPDDARRSRFAAEVDPRSATAERRMPANGISRPGVKMRSL